MREEDLPVQFVVSPYIDEKVGHYVVRRHHIQNRVGGHHFSNSVQYIIILHQSGIEQSWYRHPGKLEGHVPCRHSTGADPYTIHACPLIFPCFPLDLGVGKTCKSVRAGGTPSPPPK